MPVLLHSAKRRFTPLPILLLLAAGCSQPQTGPQTIPDVRPATPKEKAVPRVSNTAERLGLNAAPGAGALPAADAGPMAAPATFTWTTPPGWQELPTSSMRQANFKIGTAGECYLSVLPGGGGGLAANLNRWRKQMNLPDLSEAEIAALPKKPLLGKEATYLSLEGTYSGMGNQPAQENYRLLGMVLVDGGTAYFVKMTGPAAEIAAQEENFLAFCASLASGASQTASDDHAHDDHDHDDHDHGTQTATGNLPAGHPPIDGGTQTAAGNLPAGHPPIDGGTPTAAGGLPAGHPPVGPGSASAASGDFDPSQLQWTAPEAWKRAPDRQMRLATYTAGNSECVLYAFPGDVGGIEANLNRWRGQMGQPPLSPEEIAALPALTVLGQEAKVLDVQGDYTGMDGRAHTNQRMLAIAVLHKGFGIFVKLTGPAEEVAAEKSNFAAFCESLH
jgi:hypothetical protein